MSATGQNQDARLHNRKVVSKQWAYSSRHIGVGEPAQPKPELSEEFKNFASQYGIPVVEKSKIPHPRDHQGEAAHITGVCSF